MSASPLFADRHFVVSDGLRIHYRDYRGSADRPPLLCLPGLTRNCRDFADLAERYAPEFRIICPDFRGRGTSDYDPLPERYLPPTYFGDIIELLDVLAIEQAIFVGTSLGGVVTMLTAMLAPDRVAAAILNDIGPEVSEAGLARIKAYVGKDRRFRTWDEAADAIAANNAHAFDRYAHDDWVRMAKRNCRMENGEIRFDYDMAIALQFNAVSAAPQFDMWPLFAALARKPLLLVRGAKSDLLTEETAAKMRAAAPQMRFALVRGVGHAPELNEREAVAAIDDFLDAVSA